MLCSSRDTLTYSYRNTIAAVSFSPFQKAQADPSVLVSKLSERAAHILH